MNIKEQVQLIYSDVNANNNKVWYGILYDNGDVETKWGRVGYSLQSKMFPNRGLRFLESKKNEKLKSGYTHLRVVGDAPVISKVNNTELHSIASTEIVDSSNAVLMGLIKQLVNANIHQITENTKISYNSATGLFSTPLGVVDMIAISEARKQLDIIGKYVQNRDYSDSELINAVNMYLRYIPQNVGMKIKVNYLFPNMDSIARQSAILDSLESSYNYVTTPKETESTVIREKVFNVKVDVLNDSQESDRLIKFFESTKRSGHGYDRVRVKNIFTVHMPVSRESFNSGLGNIKEVFHGTSEANCLSILKSGLTIAPPSTARLAGKMFGNGVYGAINSSKSLGYTYNKWGQGGVGSSGWLMVCDFAMGRAFSTTRAATPPAGFDSVWAKASPGGLYHDELIVYKNNQVNIKYLLECK